MLGWMLENTMIACVIALIAIMIERRVRSRPAIGHVMWLTVLLVLVLPPLSLTSPVAVRGLFRPHIESFEAAAWDRLERTDPMLGWFGDGTSNSLADGLVADKPSVPILQETGSSKGQRIDAPVFMLSPGGSDRSSLGALGLHRPEVSRWSIPSAFRWLIRALWLGGAVVVLVLFLVRVRRVDRMVQSAVYADQSLMTQISAIASDLKIPVPEARVMPGAASPMVWGLGRPVLIWPGELELNDEGMRGLIAHELAHLRRGDHWIALLEVFASALLWWHPLARVAMGRMDRFAEQACDVWAVRAVAGHRREYAEALMSVVERLSGHARARAVLAATGQGRRELADRLGVVMRPDSSPSCSRPIILSAIIMLALLVPTLAPAQPEHAPASVEPGELDGSLRVIAHRAEKRQQANEWFDARVWVEAARTYEWLLNDDPSDQDARARYGIALLQLSRYDEAEQSLRHALDACSYEAELHFWLGGALAGQERTREAIEELDRALGMGLDFFIRVRTEPAFDRLIADPSSKALLDRASRVHTLRQQARHAMEAHDSAGAISALESLSELVPNDGSTWHFLSYVRIAEGQYEQALTSLDRQQGLGHRVEVAEYNRACVYALLGRSDAAVAALSRAVDAGFKDYGLVQEDPDLTSVRNEPGYREVVERVIRPARLERELQVAVEFADWTRVLAICEEFEQVGDSDLSKKARLQRAVAVAERGDSMDAIESLIAMLVDGYDPGDGFFQLGLVYAIAGDEPRALAALIASAKAGQTDRKGLVIDPRVRVLTERQGYRDATIGVVERRELGSFRVASWSELEDRARATLDREPSASEARHELGWALLRQGRHDEAEAIFKALAEGGWNTAASSYNVACCAMLQGRKSDAMDWLEKAVSAGLRNPNLFVSDRDLRPLRGMPRFERLVEQLRLEQDR